MLGTFLGGAGGAILGSVVGFIFGSFAVLIFGNEVPENHVFWGGLTGLLFGMMASGILLSVGEKIYPNADRYKLGLILGSMIGLFFGVMKGILIPNYQTLLNSGLSRV